MLAEAKYIAETGTRDGVGFGSNRALFGRFWFVAQNDLINLFQGEAGDFDRRISEPRQRPPEAFRQRFETDMTNKFDTHFLVGTIHQHPNNWIIVGLFHPPKGPMANLFD